MDKTLETLQEEYDKLSKEHNKRLNDSPANMNYHQFERYMSVTGDKLEKLGTQIRMLQEPEFEELTSRSHVMSLNEFIESVNDGMFNDYDGSGYYVRGDKESNILIHPSDVLNGNIRKDFDSVAWYNK